MIDKYIKIYPDLSIGIIVDIIDEVLNRAPDSYFTWEQVQDHPQFCKKCGRCCATITCEFFNGKTCDEYATRYDACVEFPYYDINYKTGLILDPSCQYARKLAEMVLEKRLQEEVKMLTVD